MSRTFPKITFNDKSDSWELNDDSKYVLTAGNINEIKDVVNSLSDRLNDAILKFSEVYAYLRLVVPTDLTVGNEYDIVIDISKSMDFSSPLTLKLSNSSNKFYIFDEEQNKWISFGHSSVNDEYKNRILSIDIENLIEDKGLTYFGRYRFINNSNPDENTQYIGFCLGSYNEGSSNSKKKLFRDIVISGMNGPAKFELYSGEYEKIKVIGTMIDGQLIDLTPSAQFASNNQALTINLDEMLIEANTVKVPCTCSLRYNVLYDDITYENTQEIFVRPLTFINVYSSIPSSITEDSPETVNYKVSGMTSYNELLEIPVDSVSFNFLNNDFIEASNGVCRIDKSKIEKNGTVKYIASYIGEGGAAVNNVMDIKEILVDLPFYDVMNISLSAINCSDEYIKNSNEYFTDVEYAINVLSNGNDITNSIEFENALDVDSVSISGNIIKCTSYEKTPVLLKASYRMYGKTLERHKYIMFRPLNIVDIEVTEIKRETTLDGNLISLKSVAKYENGVNVELDNAEISLLAGNPMLVKDIEHKSILFDFSTKYSENLCFMINYDGFEKRFIVTLEANENL